MTTFENAKVGDRLYHYRYGWSTITNIKKESDYPIIIDYDFSFTYEGFTDKSDKNRTLFWDEVTITPPEKPLPKLEVDAEVLVWNNEDNIKQKRYFSDFSRSNTGKLYRRKDKLDNRLYRNLEALGTSKGLTCKTYQAKSY